jgi:membrane protein required for colicin V production
LLDAQYSKILEKRRLVVNALDIGICIIGGFCLVRGLFRGIIKEVTSIVGVFVGFYGAYTYYPLLADWLSRVISNKPYLYIISFFIAFTVLFLAVSFVGVVLKHLFKTASMGGVDRLLGGFFALGKAVLIVSVLLVPLTAFLPKESPLVRRSRLAPHIVSASEWIVAAVPDELKQKFDDNLKPLKESWGKF